MMAVILVIVLIALVVLVAYLLMRNKKESMNLESYKGFWYAKEESTEHVVEYDELNIKEINKNTITFDYTLAMLCSDKNIKVEIKDGKGEFKTEESQGTITLEDNKVKLKVKNIHYDDTEFEKVFSFKSSESRNEK